MTLPREEKLKACPVCGGEPTTTVRGGAAGVNCRSSSHLIWTYGATLDEAIAAWNRRPEVGGDAHLLRRDDEDPAMYEALVEQARQRHDAELAKDRATNDGGKLEGERERVAMAVLEAMRWAVMHAPNRAPPEWVHGGNSFVQDRARQAAHAILAALSPVPSGEVDGKLEELRLLSEKATQGEWKRSTFGIRVGGRFFETALEHDDDALAIAAVNYVRSMLSPTHGGGNG